MLISDGEDNASLRARKKKKKIKKQLKESENLNLIVFGIKNLEPKVKTSLKNLCNLPEAPNFGIFIED